MAYVVFAVAVTVAVLGLHAARYLRARGAETQEAWAAAAAAVGGELSPLQGPWTDPTRELTATVEGVDVAVDHLTTHRVRTQVTWTRAKAAVDLGRPVSFSVGPKGMVERLGVALGLPDVATGDADFDDAFVVQAADPDLVRAWLTPAVRAAIVAAGRYRFTVLDDELCVTRPTLETDPQRLEAAIHATALVARRAEALRRFWHEEAEARGGAVEEVAPGRFYVELDAATPLRIETGHEGATHVVARRTGGRGEPLTWTPGEANDHPWEREAEALAPRRIEADAEEIRIVVDDLTGDGARLEETIALAEALATDRGEHYR